MKELSIFVDESGDPGTESKYYLIALVVHEQKNAIEKYEDNYKAALARQDLEDIPLHLSPLMNGHDVYRNLSVGMRKRHLAAFRVFMQYLPFRYAAFAYRKDELANGPLAPGGLVQRVRRDLTILLLDHLEYLQQFDKVKIYYDNVQPLVTKALHDAVAHALAKDATIYRDATPQRYRLSQVADYVCTIELEAIKYSGSEETATDRLFLGTKRSFEKNFLKKIRRHSLR